VRFAKAPVRMLLFDCDASEMYCGSCGFTSRFWQKFPKKDRILVAKHLGNWGEPEMKQFNRLPAILRQARVNLTSRNSRSLGFKSKRYGERFKKSAEALRNKLAHAQDLINGSSWPEVIFFSSGK